MKTLLRGLTWHGRCPRTVYDEDPYYLLVLYSLTLYLSVSSLSHQDIARQLCPVSQSDGRMYRTEICQRSLCPTLWLTMQPANCRGYNKSPYTTTLWEETSGSGYLIHSHLDQMLIDNTLIKLKEPFWLLKSLDLSTFYIVPMHFLFGSLFRTEPVERVCRISTRYLLARV